MSIVNNELVGEKLVKEETKFAAGHYNPKIHGQNIINYIAEKLKTNEDKTDLSNNKAVRFSQLQNLTKRISNWFRSRGLQKGNVILVTADNCVEIPLLFFSAWQAGAHCGGLDVNMTSEEIRNVVQETKAKFIVADEHRVGKVLDAIKDLEIKVIIIGRATFLETSFDELLLEHNEFETFSEIETDLDATAWMTFSSGTTGPPKPIIHTHRSLSPYLQPSDDKPSVLGRNFLFTNLMIHGSGLFSFMQATAHFTSSYTFFKPGTEAILKAIDSIKPSYISILSFEVAEICQFHKSDKYDVSSVESVVYTGSGVSPQHELEIFDKLPNLLNLMSMYGCSEAMLLTLSAPKPKPPLGTTREQVKSSHIVGSAGKVLPHVKIKIVDHETGEKLGPNQSGEIVAWTPFLMKGYLNRPEATARVIRNGWYLTGDKGYYDENGNLFVVGRFKEIIKYRTVIPATIEKYIMLHPAVIEAAVVGVPHDIDGEHPTAFVAVKKNEFGQPIVNEEDLVLFMNARCTKVEKLRGGVHLVDHLPRNTMGKILRVKLAEMARQKDTTAKTK